MDTLLAWLGRALAKYLSTPLPQGEQVATSPPEKLAGALEPGDVVLIEGNTRISVAIKYLTQSTWSHAALYVGDALGSPPKSGEQTSLIEANLEEGVVAVPLSKYAPFNIRVCRPVGLTSADRRKVI